jgi:uncharacterized protein YndB with AHSA1/START domain
MTEPTNPKISETAVREATGWGWDEWFGFLDEHGAKELTHKEIVKLLREEAKLTKAWWTQMVTVEYERARGLRQIGETSPGSFEIDVRRTYEVTTRRAWDVLTRPAGIRAWLGEVNGLKLEKGCTYESIDGDTGEVRSVRPGERIRLTWRPMGWEEATTIEVTVIPMARQATIAFHQENLPTDKEREKMRKHWNKALNAMEDLL